MPVLLMVASRRTEDIQFSQKVAERCGFDFETCIDPVKLDDRMIERPQTIMFVDVDSAEATTSGKPLSLSRIQPILAKRLKPRQCFALSSVPFSELKEATRTQTFSHYCVRHYDDFGVQWISRLCFPLFSPEPFGLNFYSDHDAKVNMIELKSAKERRIALEAISNLLLKRELHPRAVEMILRVGDELLMNAIFDAPVDPNDDRYRKERPRDENFPLEGKERVFLKLVFNEKFVVLGVHDQFGSFVSKNAFDAAKKDYTEFEYRPDASVVGAGLGLHGIAASGLCSMISCKAGVATEAVIAFPYYKNFKQTKSGFRSFSFNMR